MSRLGALLPWGLASVAAACAGGGRSSAAAPLDDTGWRVCYVRFEPALAAAGELFVQHECGLELSLPTGSAGVELLLPPGPAALRLVAGGRVWERPITVDGDTEYVLELER